MSPTAADLLPSALGYRVRVQVVDFSGGVPGDIGFTLKWGDLTL
jgi:hypothetical protein